MLYLGDLLNATYILNKYCDVLFTRITAGLFINLPNLSHFDNVDWSIQCVHKVTHSPLTFLK